MFSPELMMELRNAHVDSSKKNRFLNYMWLAITKYNNLWVSAKPSDSYKQTHTRKSFLGAHRRVAPMDSPKIAIVEDRVRKIKTDLLDQIALLVGEYLTHKPPRSLKWVSIGRGSRGRGKLSGQKNKQRWDVMVKLAAAVKDEAAALGTMMVYNPGDATQVFGSDSATNYVLEKIDPMHRRGNELSAQWANWLALSEDQRTESFWLWLGTETSSFTTVNYFTEDERNRHEISFDGRGNLLAYDGKVADTITNFTQHSGKGWAIFVCSPDGKLFMGSHGMTNTNANYHVSFLGAQAVSMGGEIVVDHGQIVIISAKSGHYRTPPVAVLAFVRRFLGKIPNNAIISDSGFSGRMSCYRASDYAVSGSNARKMTKQEVVADLPTWARNPLSQRKFVDNIFDAMPTTSNSNTAGGSTNYPVDYQSTGGNTASNNPPDSGIYRYNNESAPAVSLVMPSLAPVYDDTPVDQ